MYYQIMIVKNAYVWSSFSYGYRIDSPSGWLLNPQRSKMILFDSFDNSAKRGIKIKLKTFYTDYYMQPKCIESTNLISVDEAWEKWHDLQLKGWTLEAVNLRESGLEKK